MGVKNFSLFINGVEATLVKTGQVRVGQVQTHHTGVVEAVEAVVRETQGRLAGESAARVSLLLLITVS